MALYTPKYQPNGNEVAVIKTSKGDIRVELAGNDAPIHVGNFVELAQKGFYDNLKFHRYVPGFVIQGGCPNTRELDSEQVKAAEGNPFARLGTGGPVTPFTKSTPPTPITSILTALWLWLAPRILTLRAPSSICASVLSLSWIPATRYSVRRWKVLTLLVSSV